MSVTWKATSQQDLAGGAAVPGSVCVDVGKDQRPVTIHSSHENFATEAEAEDSQPQRPLIIF